MQCTLEVHLSSIQGKGIFFLYHVSCISHPYGATQTCASKFTDANLSTLHKTDQERSEGVRMKPKVPQPILPPPSANPPSSPSIQPKMPHSHTQNALLLQPSSSASFSQHELIPSQSGFDVGRLTNSGIARGGGAQPPVPPIGGIPHCGGR